MAHVLFVEPHASSAWTPGNRDDPRPFLRGLKRVGARVTGLGSLRPALLDTELRYLLDAYEYVADPSDSAALTEAVRRVQDRGPWVDRLETTTEALLDSVAETRAATSIPGDPVEVVRSTRDKWACRRALRAAGVHTVPDAPVTSVDAALVFAAEVGYPLILKPRVGRGQSQIVRLDDEAALLAAVSEITDPTSHVLERYAEGHEGFIDSLVLNGEVVFEAVTHFYPSVLDAMRTRSVSPVMVHTNRILQDGYDDVRDINRAAVRVLGVGTGACHIEWYSGAAGRWVAEVGLHPPPCRLWDLFGEAGDSDLYAEWGRALAWGTVDRSQLGPTRLAAGMVNLRPDQDGVIVGYEGVEAMQRRYGERIVRMHLPPPGSLTQPIDGGYLANAWVAVKHPDYDELRGILADMGQTVRVHASANTVVGA